MSSGAHSGARTLIALDASVVIAHFNAEDAHHGSANEILAEHPHAEFLMHTLTMVEALVVPSRMRKADQALFRLARMGVRE